MSSDRVDRRLLRQSAAARPHLALAGALGLATAAVVVAQACLLAHVISAAATHRATLSALRGSLVALGCVMALRAVLVGGFELSGRLAAARVMHELRDKLARTLLIVRPGRHPTERTGELAAAAVQGVDALESYFAGYLPSMVLAVAVPVAILGWIVPVDPVCAVALAVTVPILILFMILIGLGAESRTRSRWQALTLLSSHFLDVVRGLETLRVHRRERAQAAILSAVGERYRAQTMGTLRLAIMSSLVLELCAMIGTALAAATIGVQLTSGRLTLDAGLIVLLLAPELYNPLRQVGQQFHASADGLAAAGRLLDVLEEPSPLQERASVAGAPDPGAAKIELVGVAYAYPGRPGEVLADINLAIGPGEFVAIVGPSGAGKSSLAALLLRLADPTAGEIRCGGIDLREIPVERWRRSVAWVPQRATLFAGTIAENITLAAAGAAEPEIEDAARQAGLKELLGSLALGLRTAIGDGGRRLSAGQAQRIALARAFISGARLVILDEPTANLDGETAAGIAESIERLARDRTVVLITHDRQLAARADRVVELAAGRVLDSPAPPFALAA